MEMPHAIHRGVFCPRKVRCSTAGWGYALFSVLVSVGVVGAFGREDRLGLLVMCLFWVCVRSVYMRYEYVFDLERLALCKKSFMFVGPWWISSRYGKYDGGMNA